MEWPHRDGRVYSVLYTHMYMYIYIYMTLLVKQVHLNLAAFWGGVSKFSGLGFDVGGLI